MSLLVTLIIAFAAGFCAGCAVLALVYKQYILAGFCGIMLLFDLAMLVIRT